MKNLRLKIFISIMQFIICINCIAQQNNNFSINQCVEYAYKNSAQVKNALIDIKIQEQTNKEFTAIAYPQLSANIGINDYLNIPTSLLPAEIMGGPAGTFVPVKFGTKFNAQGGMDVSQILFDGQVFVGLQARDALMSLSKKNAEVTQEGIKTNLYKIYYQLVVAKMQVRSIDANINRFEKLLADTKEIFKNGFAEKLDVDKVTVQLNNLRTEKQKVENAITIGNSGLKFLMGMPQKDKLQLTDTLSDDILKENILSKEYQYNDRKEFQLLQIAKKLGSYNIRRYKLSYLPSLVAFGSYSKNAQRSTFDFFTKQDWFTTSLVGFKLQMSLFDGYAKKSRVNKAKLDLEKTNNNIEQLKQIIDADIEQSKLKMNNAILTVDAQNKNIILAENVFNITKKKYEQGLGSNQEIYNAQTDLKTAQTNYYSALYDAISAKIDWQKAAGKL